MQVETLEVLKPVEQKLIIKGVIPKEQLKNEAKNEIEKIKEIEKK